MISSEKFAVYVIVALAATAMAFCVIAKVLHNSRKYDDGDTFTIMAATLAMAIGIVIAVGAIFNV